MQRMRLRKIWLLGHRWLGLTVGLLLILSGLTGSLLVFRSALDEQLNQEIFSIAASDTRCSLEEILSAARSSPVAETGKVSFVDFPRSADGVWTVWFQTGTRAAPQLTQAYFDPFQAELTGYRIYGEDLMTWIYKLHIELFAGHLGETIVGITGIVLMVSVVSGILLWWPLWKHGWRSAFSIRRGARLNYDLHKTGGILSSLLLIIVAFTGVYLTFPTWIAPVVKFILADSTQSTPRPSSTPPQAGGARITADQAVEIVRDRFPDAHIRRIHPPSTPQGTYIVRFCQSGDVHRSLGSSRAWVDQYSGQVLAANEWRQKTAAEMFVSWQLPLHNGEAFGVVGRWLMFFTGLMPALLYVTGFRIWWRKRRSSHQQRVLKELRSPADVSLRIIDQSAFASGRSIPS